MFFVYATCTRSRSTAFTATVVYLTWPTVISHVVFIVIGRSAHIVGVRLLVIFGVFVLDLLGVGHGLDLESKQRGDFGQQRSLMIRHGSDLRVRVGR